MIATRAFDRRLIVGAAVAAVVLAAGSTLAMAAGSTTPGAAAPTTAAVSCAAPSLPGAVVDVTLTDMGARMRGTATSGGSGMGGQMRGPMPGPMMGGTAGSAMMPVMVTPSTAAAGTVSLRVTNAGVMTHELVVLPLPEGQAVGDRAVGTDGRVDETGSLGEVSRTCGAGSGDGLAPGSTGWTTLQLTAGRYELVCNLPGHYAAGMSALLSVN